MKQSDPMFGGEKSRAVVGPEGTCGLVRGLRTFVAMCWILMLEKILELVWGLRALVDVEF